MPSNVRVPSEGRDPLDRRSRRENNLAPATVNRELAFPRRVFNVAIAWGLADTNPVKHVRLFK